MSSDQQAALKARAKCGCKQRASFTIKIHTCGLVVLGAYVAVALLLAAFILGGRYA